MKVLLLGAGASKPAGYPLASELMTTIERDARESRNDGLRHAWELWEETRRSAPGPLRLLLEDPNPEVSLSVLDLCSISYYGSFPAVFRDERRNDAVSASLSEADYQSNSSYHATTSGFTMQVQCGYASSNR